MATQASETQRKVLEVLSISPEHCIEVTRGTAFVGEFGKGESEYVGPATMRALEREGWIVLDRAGRSKIYKISQLGRDQIA